MIKNYENKMRKPPENKCEQRTFTAEEICKVTRIKPSEIRGLKQSKKTK